MKKYPELYKELTAKISSSYYQEIPKELADENRDVNTDNVSEIFTIKFSDEPLDITTVRNKTKSVREKCLETNT